MSDTLPAVFTVYKTGEIPRKIHAVDWAAHQINGWQREPLAVMVETVQEEVQEVQEVQETQEESLAQKTRQKRTQT